MEVPFIAPYLNILGVNKQIRKEALPVLADQFLPQCWCWKVYTQLGQDALMSFCRFAEIMTPIAPNIDCSFRAVRSTDLNTKGKGAVVSRIIRLLEKQIPSGLEDVRREWLEWTMKPAAHPYTWNLMKHYELIGDVNIWYKLSKGPWHEEVSVSGKLLHLDWSALPSICSLNVSREEDIAVSW